MTLMICICWFICICICICQNRSVFYNLGFLGRCSSRITHRCFMHKTRRGDTKKREEKQKNIRGDEEKRTYDCALHMRACRGHTPMTHCFVDADKSHGAFLVILCFLGFSSVTINRFRDNLITVYNLCTYCFIHMNFYTSYLNL